MRSPVVVASLISCLLSTGCYLEKPLTTMPPAPATRIVAQLTDSGTVALSNSIGPGALKLEGVVSQANVDAWVLQLIRVEHRDGRAINWNREPVTVRPGLLANPTVKILDRKRSWLAAGAITLFAVLAATAFDLFGSPDDEPDPEPPPASVIPDGGR